MPPYIINYDSSIFTSKLDVVAVARDIALRAARDCPVIAVIPALRGRREQLIDAARKRFLLESTPQFAEYVASGGQEAAILALHALRDLEIDATIATARRIGLIAERIGQDVEPTLLDSNAFVEIFKSVSVLIVPGDSAVDAHGGHILLEPSGNVAAVHLASRLGGAHMLVVKDIAAFDNVAVGKAQGRCKQVKLTHAEAFAWKPPPTTVHALKRASAHQINIDVAALGARASMRIGR